MSALKGRHSKVILQREIKEGEQSSMLPNLIVSFTAFLAGGPVAGTPSKRGRSLIYKTTLAVGVSFIVPLNDIDSHRIFES